MIKVVVDRDSNAMRDCVGVFLCIPLEFGHEYKKE